MVMVIGKVQYSGLGTLSPLRVLSKIYGAEEKLNLLCLAHLKVCGGNFTIKSSLIHNYTHGHVT